MRRALLVHNVTAGRREAPGSLAAVTAALEQAGYEVEPRAVDDAGPAVEAARAGVSRGIDVVFAMGGDGTVRDVASALHGGHVPLGVLPAGTTNVVARALGLPLDAVAAARALAASRTLAMDVGLCGERLFLMQASAGFDASLMARVDRRLKARFGRVSIAVQGLFQWWRYAYPELEVRLDGRATCARQLVACNISEYGGSFRIVPSGRFDDRRLDVVLFRGRGRRATLSFYLDLMRGAHEGRDDVEITSADVVELVGPPGVHVQIDGDPVTGAVPVVMRLAPEPLQVLVPA